ncbi:MAG: leucine-rich repeat protein [Bacteroides sp.]|nr:leucine-rich repeat protein [Bacteroides sp.]
MKRNLLWWAGAGMLLSAVTACTEEVETQDLAGELREVTVTAKDFTPEAESRAFSIENNYVSFSWADGDTIGIFPTTGAQAYFPIIAGSEDGNSASFTGGGWALKTSSAYASYYPFVGDFYLNKEAIPVTYVGQKQTGNASMAHLSAYDYMTASATTPTSGMVNFQFSHLNAFVQLKITMPQGGTLSSVTLSAGEAVFTTEGTYDLTAATPAITATQNSKTLTLEVEDVTTTAESNVATLYLMLAPVDFTDKTLSAIVKTSDGKSETITLTGKNFKAGGAYGVSGTMKDPNGGVTAGDGTYANGVVSVDVAGNMKSLLGSDYLNITELKVVGPINGFDIYYLRKMLGCSHFSSADWGKLTTLDLSEATIVEGDWYWDPSSTSGNEYYSENNVVGDYMFYKCANLKNIELPVNITSIGGYAFYNCDSLTSIQVPDGVTSIGSKAFYDCEALIEATIPSGTIGSSAFYDCGALTNVSIGDGVTSIGSSAFYDCDALTNVSIGDGVTSIGSSAFYDCNALTNVYITDLSAWCKISFSDVYSNPLYNLAKLYLNNNLVTELTIPDDITEIKDYTFRGCESIIKVIIPDHVTSIGNYAFQYCSALTNVSIGNGVTSIGSSAFQYCGALTNVSIGSGVTSIDDGAFRGCSITECYCYAPTPPTLASYAFYNGLGTDAILYIPIRGGGSVYKSSDWGDYFTNIIEMD